MSDNRDFVYVFLSTVGGCLVKKGGRYGVRREGAVFDETGVVAAAGGYAERRGWGWTEKVSRKVLGLRDTRVLAERARAMFEEHRRAWLREALRRAEDRLMVDVVARLSPPVGGYVAESRATGHLFFLRLYCEAEDGGSASRGPAGATRCPDVAGALAWQKKASEGGAAQPLQETGTLTGFPFAVGYVLTDWLERPLRGSLRSLRRSVETPP